MKKVLAIVVAVIVLAGISFWQLGNSSKTAPQAQFTSLDGKQFNTDDLRGKVVLVKFWATSCVTCIQQMPDTINTYQNYSDQGYDVIAVAMAYDKANYVQNFAESRELPFTVVHDTQGEIAQAFGDVKLTPTAFLIDKQGRIVKRYLGNYDQETFVATIKKALAG